MVLPITWTPLLSVAPDGLFRGRRTELPEGEAIGGGGTKYLGYCKDAGHRFHERSGEEALTNTQAILAPLTPLSLPLSVASDGSFRGRRTELPAGGAIGEGGTKDRAYRKDAHHRLHNKSGKEALKNTRAILVLPPLLGPCFLSPPTDHSEGNILSYRREGPLVKEAPNIAHTAKTLTIAFTTGWARTH